MSSPVYITCSYIEGDKNERAKLEDYLENISIKNNDEKTKRGTIDRIKQTYYVESYWVAEGERFEGFGDVVKKGSMVFSFLAEETGLCIHGSIVNGQKVSMENIELH